MPTSSKARDLDRLLMWLTVVGASDLHPVHPGNIMAKYVNDNTYSLELQGEVQWRMS